MKSPGPICSGICAIILSVAFLGCGGPRRDLIGKWRSTSEASNIIWEFSENGAVKTGGTQGRYSFGDRERIKIETPFGISIYQMEFAGDRLTLKAPGGSKLEFTRVK